MDKSERQFEIVDIIGIIANETKGWRKALTRVSWNGRDPKYDIRAWDSHYEKMGKGITLSEAELRRLKELIDEELNTLDSL